ncbi:ClbS/DfsB family four-helix bundle protein [Thalassococcus sp. CAU 1522]|uniref:ClbS/DfsB family four-helix bundle protein n=1 Tax=Thalassococcus arenae TaxID=2851652 RepID=A0ABS6N5C5_9RHOB|nr:ClbS/DfsB family four-helix bundle protein [Thalassococcus arenae]MBV2358740.1 ClbS/DfsB family four-helix bundle protein [Thalassococcus arenae]
MPAATTKKDLSAITASEFAKFERVLDSVPEALRLKPDPGADDTTLKDIAGHRAHWIALFLDWYARGQAGEPVEMPAPGYKWNELRRFNADLRAAQAGLDWDAARTLLRDNHARLMDFIAARDDAALYGAPMPGGGNAWTPGRWAEAAGASHYRSAAKYIRARLKAAKAPG